MHLMYLEWTHVHTCYAMYHKRKNVKKITIFIALFRKIVVSNIFFNYVSLAINFPPAAKDINCTKKWYNNKKKIPAI